MLGDLLGFTENLTLKEGTKLRITSKPLTEDINSLGCVLGILIKSLED